MTPVELERQRCAKLIDNAMRRHKHHILMTEVLRRIRNKILRPKQKRIGDD